MTDKNKSKNANRKCVRLWITGLAASILLVAGTVVPDKTHATSRTPQKYSKDVPNNTNFVDVVIQPAGPWTSSLDTEIKTKGGKVKQTFKNFPARVVTMRGNDAINESTRTDVRYVSLVRQTWPMGHVSLTSGADQASVMAPTGSTFDGTGVGIAVLDSGIDPNHIALTDAQSRSRIVVNQDFTGELDANGFPITSDPYGHGTHVANIAAGNGKVAQGSYVGIAPNASIINLRVLNSQGVGTEAALLNALDWVATNRSTYNIRVINMSLGMPAIDSYQFDPVCQAVRSLVNSGVVAVAAPGNKIVSAEAYQNHLVTTYPTIDAGVSTDDTHKMMFLNGTSMATPVVAGAAALLLQANPKLTPNLVKAILMYTAQQLANFDTF